MYRFIEAKLDDWKKSEDRKPLVLKGARQVGKTFTLKNWGKSRFSKVHYINFEELAEAIKIFERNFFIPRILEELGFFTQTKISISADELLILDEIQFAPKALTSLKYFCENAPQLAVCAAGSLLGVILNEESFPVGKVNFLSMYPLSFFEFLQTADEKEAWRLIPEPSPEAIIPAAIHQHLWGLTKWYYVTGGMPEAVKTFVKNQHDPQKAVLSVREVHRELVKGYESDFVKHAGKNNATHIQALYRSIASQLGQANDFSSRRFRFNEVLSGKKGFAVWELPLHWLINAGLVLEIKIANQAMIPLEHFTKSNMFKLYVHDIGLLGSLQNVDPVSLLKQEYGTAKGYFAENFVAQELKAAEPFFDSKLYCWQEGTAEIEFIFQYQELFIPIEVKSGQRTKAKSLQAYKQRYNPPLSIKISANEYSWDAQKGLLNLPLYLASWAQSLRPNQSN